MMELEIIPITAATLSWSRLINHDSSWVENQQHFLCFIYQPQLVLSSAALLACRPGFLCRSVQLPKQGGKKAPKQVQNRGPHRPPQWKADGGFFWRQPAAVSSPGEETSHSVSSIIGPGSRRRRRTGGGQTVRGLTPDVWPLSNVFALAHSWLTLERTCENRQHVHALRTVKLFWLTSGFLAFHQLYSLQQQVTWQGYSCFCLWDPLWILVYIISKSNQV